MEYQLDKNQLLEELLQWNAFLKKKVRLVACGGTAMTLLGVKSSTKDVDFMVPDIGEHNYLIKQLKSLDYKQISGSGWKREGGIFQFDIFKGNRIHTTELMTSPLEPEGHTMIKEFSMVKLLILNDYDLISSKLMRGTSVDFEDCLALAKAHNDKIDLDLLTSHFHELVDYEVGENRIRPHIDSFLKMLKG
jgi:hypothetical protein